MIGTAARAGMLEDLFGASGNLVYEMRSKQLLDVKEDAAFWLILSIMAGG